MIVRHAGGVSVVKMRTILEIVEHAHIPVTVFPARLTELCLENEVLDLDSFDQGNIVGGTNLIFVLALRKMLDEPHALFFSPFPNPFVGCNKLPQRFLGIEILLVNKFVIFRDGRDGLGAIAYKALVPARKKRKIKRFITDESLGWDLVWSRRKLRRFELREKHPNGRKQSLCHKTNISRRYLFQF